MRKNLKTIDAGLDAVLHQPTRTQITAYLFGRGEATFTELRRALNSSDGNLESHMKKLIQADYVVTRKDSSATRQQTLYMLTDHGRKALRTYTRNLHRMLGPISEQSADKTDALTIDGKLGWQR